MIVSRSRPAGGADLTRRSAGVRIRGNGWDDQPTGVRPVLELDPAARASEVIFVCVRDPGRVSGRSDVDGRGPPVITRKPPSRIPP